VIPVRVYAAIGLLALGGLAAWYVMYLRADLAACRFAAAGLSESLDVQNKAVDRLAKAGEAARQAAREAQQQAEAAEELAKSAEAARRSAIAAGKAPASCSAAINAIRSELRP
jgi:hypothetical protein